MFHEIILEEVTLTEKMEGKIYAIQDEMYIRFTNID